MGYRIRRDTMISPFRQLRSLSQPSQRLRPFSSSTRCLVNPLQNLSHFSAAKEAQFLSKEKRIPREEFHPYLQLIRSSEVDPFAPIPGASPSVVAALKHAKTGEADTDTALRLAVSNLIDQVQTSRHETASVLRALAHVEQRYRREERNALLMLVASLSLLAFIMIKTRALSDMLDYAGGVQHEWRSFDWQSLSNSSSHVRDPRIRDLPLATQTIQDPEGESYSSETAPDKTPGRSADADLVGQESLTQAKPRSLVWRLFWAE